MIIVCDIDGTVSDHSHRIAHVTTQRPKDWNAYYSKMLLDRPLQGALDHLTRIIRMTSPNFFFLTGRPEQYRKVTEEWFREHFGIICVHLGTVPVSGIGVQLVMRPDQDYRSSSDFKEELSKFLFTAGTNFRHPILFLDDDLRNREMYRKYGVQLKAPECWDVFT